MCVFLEIRLCGTYTWMCASVSQWDETSGETTVCLTFFAPDGDDHFRNDQKVSLIYQDLCLSIKRRRYGQPQTG